MANRPTDPDSDDDRVESLYRDLFELSRDGIYLFRPDGTIERVNRRAVEQTGRPEDELAGGTTVLELHPEEARPDARAAVEAVLEEGFVRVELPFERAGGDRWIGGISASLVEVEGEPRIQAVVRDVTRRTRTRRALRRAKERLEGIFDIVPVAMTIQDPDTHEFLRVNRAFVEMFGFEREEVLGGPEPIADLWEDPEQRRQINRRIGRGETVRQEEVAFRNRDGELFHTLFSMTERSVGEERWRIGAAQDITPRVRAERELEHRALHDHLTGLANRALFWDRLEHALARARRTGERVAVLFLDLDGFKRVNDAHGHAAGDEVLRRLAGRLDEVVREQDTLARLGGDEFGILLEALQDEEEALEVARRVVEEPSTRIEVDGGSIELALSCGVAFAGGPDDRREDLSAAADELVRRADRAMYVAKEEAGSAFRTYDAAG